MAASTGKRGNIAKPRNDTEVVLKKSRVRAAVRTLGSLLQSLTNTETRTQAQVKAVDNEGQLGRQTGFDSSIDSRPPFIPPPPAPLPEQRLTSARDRAGIKVARGIPLTPEDVLALSSGEQLP